MQLHSPKTQITKYMLHRACNSAWWGNSNNRLDNPHFPYDHLELLSSHLWRPMLKVWGTQGDRDWVISISQYMQHVLSEVFMSYMFTFRANFLNTIGKT